MILVLDTNQLIFAFGPDKDHPSKALLRALISTDHVFIRIPQTVVEEARDNLHPSLFSACMKFIHEFGTVDEDTFIPFEYGKKYEAMHLKAEDSLIAAYTDWIGAEALISENRHFLSRQSNLPFKVMTASQCLKTLFKV